jgi:sugar phosphate isomerase/epimerase
MKNYTVSRRELVVGGAGFGLGAMALPLMPARSVAAPARIAGIQLYTVRASMEHDVPGTLRAIAGIGYREVEFAGYGDRSPRQIRQLLEDLGLRAPSSHMDARALRKDPLPQIETAAEIGHDYVTIGWIEAADRQSIDDFRRWAQDCNRIGAVCREHGMRLAYHNHDFELLPLNGILPYDILLGETDPELVDFQLDFYWARKAGHDVQSILAKSPQRFTMAHLKDIDDAGNMADVGAGNIDFAAILAGPAASGLTHLFVERDDADDPFKSAAISHLALEAILEK